MFKTLANAWKIPDLRKKILFTVFIVVIFRIGANIPVPFISIPATGLIDASSGTTFLNYLSMMTGDAFNYGTIFALSITPYINSSIIIQLLTVAIPALERLSKEGEEGRKKIASITRYVTIALGILQSVAYFIYLNAKKYVLYTGSSTFPKIFQGFVIIAILTAGTALVMWLGEQINDKGIGNGISIILFAGIVSRIPTEMTSLFSTNPKVGSYFSRGGAYYFLAPFVLVCYILMVAYIVWMDNAERRIPVQYAKRVVGRKMYGGQSTHIPIKVNMSGVMPIIFASSILSIPPTVQMFVASKIKDGGFDQFIQRFRVDLEALAIQKFNDVCFLLCAPAASGVKLFGGFDCNRYPHFDFLKLCGGRLASDPRDHEGGNNSRDKSDHGVCNAGKINSHCLYPRFLLCRFFLFS